MFEKQNKKGFTIIELLLVVAIVSVLASVFMFNATQAKEKAQDAHMATESHQVELALNMFKEKNGFMPSDLSVTAGKLYAEADPKYGTNLQPLVDSGFIPSIPRSPDGISYAYGVSTDRKQAVFVANLKSGSSGSSGLNNSCNLIEPELDINWSYNYNPSVVRTGDEIHSAFCISSFEHMYYCLPFTSRESGISLLTEKCVLYYDQTPAVSFPGNNPTEKCTNFAEDKLQNVFFYEPNIELNLMFSINGVPESVCSGDELCVCVE